MRLSRFVLAASVWVASVIAVATVAWYAIDSAGRQVTLLASDSSRPVVVRTAPVGPDDGLQSPTPVPPPSPTPTPTITPTLGEPVATSPGDTPSASPRPTTARSRTTSPTSSRPDPTRSTRSPDPRDSSKGAPRTDTVRTRGGAVTVACQREHDIGYSVTPDQGWRGRGDKTGHQTAEITFTRSGTTVEVHASCEDGRPRTRVDESRD